MTLTIFLDATNSCSISEALEGGIPDVPLTGGWDSSTISGTTMTAITQHDGDHTYLLGTYSHTVNGLSYYTNGDSTWCGRPRTAQITWICGERHLEVVHADEPESCEYHFQVEIDCCRETWSGMFFL